MILAVLVAQLSPRRAYDVVDVLKPCDVAFEQFKIHFKKHYQSPEAESLALKNFCQNIQSITKLRAERPENEFQINANSDMLFHPVSGYIEPDRSLLPHYSPNQNIARKQASTKMDHASAGDNSYTNSD